jgi:hypothetical protein
MLAMELELCGVTAVHILLYMAQLNAGIPTQMFSLRFTNSLSCRQES